MSTHLPFQLRKERTHNSLGLPSDAHFPVVMSVLNVTPDSFSDGGNFETKDAIKRQCDFFAEHGTTIIDIGGESTRPGSDPVPLETEWARVHEALKQAATYPGMLVSIDTQKAEIARRALLEGASIVDDVSGLADPEMPRVVADAQCPTIVMHMRGAPKTMQDGVIEYENLLEEIARSLQTSMGRALEAGLAAEKLIVDPGIGFGKTLEHNLVLTRELHRFHDLGAPVLYGPSRKRFLGALTGKEAHDRDLATAAVVALGIEFGADIVRVHNPAVCEDAIKVAGALAAIRGSLPS